MRKFIALLSITILPFVAFPQYTIIPQPAELRPDEGQFVVDENTKIYVQSGQKELKSIAQMFIDQFNAASGMTLVVQEISPKNQIPNTIVFSLKKLFDKNISDESYHLSINKNNIQVIATKPKGAFYALQSLFQLLPPTIFSSLKVVGAKWVIPCCDIKDMPRYAYRGMHLDVGRHFFSVSFIEKYIDLMALHKMNNFHWHLTEDQGWRIEIKKYPRLTEIGSKRKETMAGKYEENRYDGTPYGGFYTQEEIKEVVAYAQSKYINVIPEIEMPGHALAALAAYPELGCTGGSYEVGTHWGVYDDVFCPTEKTFEFIENVLTEVIALFPSTYIHIGGDECPKTTWKNSKFCQDLMKQQGLKDEHELQSYFIKRIDKFLTAKGKKMIGWDEILEGGLSPNATVMSWQGIAGGIAAAKQKHNVIMTPESYCYLNHSQDGNPQDSVGTGGYLAIEKVYSYEPTPTELTLEKGKYILGTQGNLWTEYIQTPEQVEYMTFPRASALAEVAWSPKIVRNFNDFAKRLKVHQERLKYLGVNFYPKSLYNISVKTIASKIAPLTVSLQSTASVIESDETVIRYTTDRSTPTAKSPIYKKSLAVTDRLTVIKAATFSKDGQLLSNVISKDYFISKSTGKSYTLTNKNSPTYTGGSEFGLTNGVKGEENKLDSWVGFEGKDLEAVVDLGEVIDLNRVSVAFLRKNESWIFLPTMIEVASSIDGKTFEIVQKIELDATMNNEVSIRNIGIGTGKLQARYVKVFAKNYGLLPEGHPGKGNPAWLFVDEIVVD